MHWEIGANLKSSSGIIATDKAVASGHANIDQIDIILCFFFKLSHNVRFH